MDNFDLILLLTVLSFGLPANVYFCYTLNCQPSVRRRRRSGSQSMLAKLSSYHSNYRLLQRNLNISDLMLLLTHVPTKLALELEATNAWTSGALMCSLIPSLNSLTHHATSNMVACIAILRMIGALSPRPNGTLFLRYTVVLLLLAAWLSAILFSVFAFYVAEIWHYVRFNSTQPESLCLNIWIVERLKRNQVELLPQEHIYYLVDELSRFWVPAAVIVVAYTVVFFRITQAARRLSRASTCDLSNNNHSPSVSRMLPPKRTHDRYSRTPSADSFGSPLAKWSTQASSTFSFGSVGPNAGSSKRSTMNMVRLTKTVLAYFICWLPYSLLSVTRSLHLVKPELASFLQDLVVVSSAINPIFYSSSLNVFSCTKAGRTTSQNLTCVSERVSLLYPKDPQRIGYKSLPHSNIETDRRSQVAASSYVSLSR